MKKAPLTQEDILSWIVATKDKTGFFLTASDKTVWRRLPKGDFEIVPGETGMTIDRALRHKKRGLVNPDGTRLALSLQDFRIKHGLLRRTRDTALSHAKKPPLTEDQIIAWICATKEKTGKDLTSTTKEVWQRAPNGSFSLVEGVSGQALNDALFMKRRGLCNPDGTHIARSLFDLKKKHGLVVVRQTSQKIKNDLSEDEIVAWLQATREKTGKDVYKATKTLWQKTDDGSFEIVPSLNGMILDYAFRYGTRGLRKPNGELVAKSLDSFKKRIGLIGARQKRAKPEDLTPVDAKKTQELNEMRQERRKRKNDLSEDEIVSWIQATREKTGKDVYKSTKTLWQKSDEGSFEAVPRVNGAILNYIIRHGSRGLRTPEGESVAASLHDFKKKHGLGTGYKKQADPSQRVSSLYDPQQVALKSEPRANPQDQALLDTAIDPDDFWLGAEGSQQIEISKKRRSVMLLEQYAGHRPSLAISKACFVSPDLQDNIGQLRLAAVELMLKKGRKPKLGELAHATGFSLRTIQNLIEAPRVPVALDTLSHGTDRDQSFGVDQDASSGFETIARKQMREALVKSMEAIPVNEAAILRLRFGFDDQCERTLAEVAQIMEVTRERVRQIEMRAMARLACGSFAAELRGHLEQSTRPGGANKSPALSPDKKTLG